MSYPLYNITKNNNPSQSLVILGWVGYGSIRGRRGEGERGESGTAGESGSGRSKKLRSQLAVEVCQTFL